VPLLVDIGGSEIKSRDDPLLEPPTHPLVHAYMLTAHDLHQPRRYMYSYMVTVQMFHIYV
jgi:hypothetical protein